MQTPSGDDDESHETHRIIQSVVDGECDHPIPPDASSRFKGRRGKLLLDRRLLLNIFSGTSHTDSSLLSFFLSFLAFPSFFSADIIVAKCPVRRRCTDRRQIIRQECINSWLS